jgi:hypothetical protein
MKAEKEEINKHEARKKERNSNRGIMYLTRKELVVSAYMDSRDSIRFHSSS